MHGIASIITRIFKKRIEKWHPAFSWLCTFAFVTLAWVYFRADSIGQGTQLIKQLASLNFGPIDANIVSAFAMPEFTLFMDILKQSYTWILPLCYGLVFIAMLNMKNTNERLENFKVNSFKAVTVSLLLVWSVVSMSGISEFLYWNF